MMMNTRHMVVAGLLAALGLAASAGAFDRPGSDEVRIIKKVRPDRAAAQPTLTAGGGELSELKVWSDDGVVYELIPSLVRTRHVVPRLTPGGDGAVELHMDIEDGDHVFDLLPRLVKGQPGMVELKVGGLGRPEQVDGHVVVVDATPTRWSVGQPEPKGLGISATTTEGSKGSSRVMIVQDDNAVAIRMEDGKIVSAELNGKQVPLDRVQRDGEMVKILDESGKVVTEFKLGANAAGQSPRRVVVRGMDVAGGAPGDATAWVTATAEPPKAMLGVQLGEPDRMLLGHFGLKPGEATLITGVYQGLPAGKMGIEPYDLVISVNGKTPAGQNDVRSALREKDEGDQVTLTIIHKGERREVKVKLTRFDPEVLEKAQLDKVEGDAMAFSLGSNEGGAGNIFVAPGLGALRNLEGQDLEKWREFAERWREDAARFKDGTRDFPAIPAPPSVPGRGDDVFRAAPVIPAPPGMDRPGAGSTDSRWEKLEERLDRLERMIERLAESRERAAPKKN